MSISNKKKLAFISFRDEKDAVISGTFELLSIKNNYIQFASSTSKFTIPVARILKVKEKNLIVDLEKKEIYAESYDKKYKKLNREEE